MKVLDKKLGAGASFQVTLLLLLVALALWFIVLPRFMNKKEV